MQSAKEKVAIIGYSCLFPGAKSPEEFWQTLIERQDKTAKATWQELDADPQAFYQPQKGIPDKTYSLTGGFVPAFAFDTADYNLPEATLEKLDPLFKGTLYTARQALLEGGYFGDRQALARCGAILGNLSFPTQSSQQVFARAYQQAIAPPLAELLGQDGFPWPEAETAAPANALVSGLPPALVARAFGLGGIHFSLDAACASSLYAIELACQQLQAGRADLMLAGAISYADPLFVRMLFAGIQAYPENGISRPLDRHSRGLTPADGIGMVLLKRYTDACRDGDRICATIGAIGLSNDGRGKHLLSPNQKGQVLAYERAYRQAGLHPRAIDYLECHATGTLMGDTTELRSIEAFFGRQGASPRLGAAKANVGHLLTAAGMVGTLKILLGLAAEKIPPTLPVTDPIVSPDRLVTEALPWPQNGSVRRAAVDAFGFGGTNAHLILEGPAPLPAEAPAPPAPTAVPAPSLAIIGMDVTFGPCSDLAAFERSVYEGTAQFIPVPERRWQGVERQAQWLAAAGLTQAPLGAYISDFAIDPLRYRIPPNELERLSPQQLLMLQVADRALQAAGIAVGDNVATIVAMETDPASHQLPQRWRLPAQLEAGLQQAKLHLPDDRRAELASVVRASLQPPAGGTEFVGCIGNLIPSRIASLWDFTAPAFTLSAGETATAKALEVAQQLLATGEADAVLVGAIDLAGSFESVFWRSQLAPTNAGPQTLSFDRQAEGWSVGEGAGAIVLKRLDRARADGDRIYATIEAVAIEQDHTDDSDFPYAPSAETVARTCQKALTQAGLSASSIGYLEAWASGFPQEDAAEVTGLLQAYRPGGTNDLSCALGSVKAKFGHAGVAAGMAGLIEAALCLYHRYLPAVPNWSGPKQPERWQGSPFYVVPESHPWFAPAGGAPRVAATNSLGLDGSCAHIILAEAPATAGLPSPRGRQFLATKPPYLFPIAAPDRAGLQAALTALKETTTASETPLPQAARRAWVAFQTQTAAPYALALLARDRAELLQEIERATTGVEKAFAAQGEWQTPAGSYFTAKPLGQRGKVAFVYPAAYNAYLGVGQDLPHLFSSSFENPTLKDASDRAAAVVKSVYPRSLQKLSRRQLEAREQRLLQDPRAMLETEVAIASLLSGILKDTFGLQPDSAFGYSLGETSMMAALGVWKSFNQGSQTLHRSPLFATRLAGPKEAAREYWQEAAAVNWSNYVLLAAADRVRDCLKPGDRVYLTQISTPTEVVIAGDDEACQQLIAALNCPAFRAPFDHIVHCDVLASEYSELVRVNALPTNDALPAITFYGAARYAPLTLERDAIARDIAQNLCQPIDFPRLVERAYADGNRIFIEAGVGNICSRWIGAILKERERVCTFLNRRGMDDRTALVRALAMLTSHRVALDLSPLYLPETATPSARAHRIFLGRTSIADALLPPENRDRFKASPAAPPTPSVLAPSPHRQQQTPSSSASLPIPNHGGSQPNMNEPATIPTLEAAIAASDSCQNGRRPQPDLTRQLQQLASNQAQLSETHATFLQARRQSLQQLGEIERLQVQCSREWVEETSAPIPEKTPSNPAATPARETASKVNR